MDFEAKVQGGTFQWQAKTLVWNSVFTNLSDSSEYSGTTTQQLLIFAPTAAMNQFVYRCVVAVPGMPPLMSHLDTLTVYPELAPPVITDDNPILRTGSYAAYQWLLDGNPIANPTDSILLISQTGSYSVRVTDSNGCVAISAPHVVTQVHTGVETVFPLAAIRLYPNPAAGFLYLVQLSAGSFQYQMYST